MLVEVHRLDTIDYFELDDPEMHVEGPHIMLKDKSGAFRAIFNAAHVSAIIVGTEEEVLHGH